MIEWTNQKINYYYAIEALRNGEELDSVLVEINKSIDGSFSQYKSSGQLIKSKLNKLISLNKQIKTALDIEDDSLKSTENTTLDSLYSMIGKIYQLDFMINDSAISYYEKVIDDFPDSRFRYESMTALNSLDQNHWNQLIVNEYPDSAYISDSSYKSINIIKEIDNELFIDIEVDRLELLTSFTSLFGNEMDSASVIDTTNINTSLDSLKNKANDVQ